MIEDNHIFCSEGQLQTQKKNVEKYEDGEEKQIYVVMGRGRHIKEKVGT